MSRGNINFNYSSYLTQEEEAAIIRAGIQHNPSVQQQINTHYMASASDSLNKKLPKTVNIDC